MSQKSTEAFRTISEVASSLNIPPHVLRFWETKFTAVKPLKRSGGRRYYRPDDVALLRLIRTLLYEEGFTIKGAQKHLSSRSAEDMLPDAQASNGDPLVEAMRSLQTASEGLARLRVRLGG